MFLFSLGSNKPSETAPTVAQESIPQYEDDDLPKDVWSAHALQQEFEAHAIEMAGRSIKIAGHVSDGQSFDMGLGHVRYLALDTLYIAGPSVGLYFNPSSTDFRIPFETIERLQSIRPGSPIVASCVIEPIGRQLCLQAPKDPRDGQRVCVVLAQCHLLDPGAIAQDGPPAPAETPMPMIATTPVYVAPTSEAPRAVAAAVPDADLFRSPAPLDCNATISLAQKLVCADVDLSAREVTVRRLFDSAHIAAFNKSPETAKALVADYMASSAERDACQDRACIASWLDSREAQLRAPGAASK